MMVNNARKNVICLQIGVFHAHPTV